MKIKSLMHLIRIMVMAELNSSVLMDENNWSKQTVEFNNVASEDKFFGFNHVSRLIYGIIVSRGVI